MSSEQFLRAGSPEGFGAHELLNAGRWIEHWIEHHQIEGTRSTGFEADNGQRMSLVLEVYGRSVRHVYFLIEVEKVVATEVLADG